MEIEKDDNKIVVQSLIAIVILFFIMWMYDSISLQGSNSLFISIPGNLLFTLAALLASVVALEESKIWGGRSNTFGKSFFYFGIGLLSYGLSFFLRMSYFYIFNSNIPFPSVHDFFRILYYPLVIYAIIILVIELKNNFSFKESVALLLIPLSLLVLVYLIVSGAGLIDSKSPVSSAIAIFYPVADMVLIALCVMLIILCYKGHFERPFTLITLGILFQVIGDLGFAFTSLNHTYYAGSWVDLILTVGVTIIAIGIYLSKPVKEMQLKKNI